MSNYVETTTPGRLIDRASISPFKPIAPPPQIKKAKRRHRFNKDQMDHLSPFEKLLFDKFGQGPIESPSYDSIHHAIEKNAALYPELIAVEHAKESITYRELNRRANFLAHELQARGVQAGDFVPLYVRRSIPMVIGILAILKVGAAYVPQDVKVVPEPQLRHIAKVSHASVILTLSQFAERVPQDEGWSVLSLDEFVAHPAANLSRFDGIFLPDRSLEPDDRCFLLFTSGTTGNPNGVQVTHRNVCNILLTAPGNLGMRPGVRVGQILSISFDMAAWEILGSLSNGATLVIRGKAIDSIGDQVNVIIATPTILSTFDVDQCPNVHVVAVAGEPCPKALADKWSSRATFYNSCGPTETTIVNTMQRYQADGDGLTIGKPTPNNTVYVLDKDLKPCHIGEVGEMWAGGDCVTAGYLNNPDLTSDRYRPDPFLGGNHVMFRTRDLGRWTPAGELEHFGRTDDQVKVRGFRVELDSVSSILEAIPTCKRAVTLKLDDRNLVGFVSPATIDAEAAKAAVDKALPYYCVPTFVMSLDSLPMTSRGKVDKRKLMEMAKQHQAELAAANGVGHD